MAGLTVLMTLEKRSKIGPALARVSGVGMLAAGALIVLHPMR
jgi:predicted metal-binding membrane protein